MNKKNEASGKNDSKIYVQTKGLTKKYNSVPAVSQVDLQIHQGDIFGIIGKNGAGKTTLFKLLLGLSIPTGGEISLFGETSKESRRKACREIGSFIGSGFFPYLSARENLNYYAKIRGVENSKGKISQLLDTVKLKDDKKKFSAYSMGMKQRLGLAAALLNQPRMVVLDEPVNGLDPEGIKEIRNIIKYLHQEQGITFVVSSHILSELEMVATTFAFLHEGELVKEITAKELHQEQKDALRLQVSDVIKAKSLLMKSLNIKEEKLVITEDGELVIENLETPSNVVAKLLVDNQIDLFKLQPRTYTLEEFFFDIVERR